MTLWWWCWRESNRPSIGARFSDDALALRNLHCHYFEILHITETKDGIPLLGD